jgi:hypothetical protein
MGQVNWLESVERVLGGLAASQDLACQALSKFYTWRCTRLVDRVLFASVGARECGDTCWEGGLIGGLGGVAVGRRAIWEEFLGNMHVMGCAFAMGRQD